MLEIEKITDKEIAEQVDHELAGMTRIEIQSFLHNILADKKHSYHDRNHPKHNITVKAVHEVYKRLYPEERKE